MVLEKIAAILAAQFEVDAETITADTDFVEDLNPGRGDRKYPHGRRPGCLHRRAYVIVERTRKAEKILCLLFVEVTEWI